MKEKHERGTYEQVVSMHETAMRNDWIVSICRDAIGFYLRVIGKAKRLEHYRGIPSRMDS